VEGLAARLEDEPNDLEGWLRLIHAYKVLAEDGQARAALATARETFGQDADALARLDEAAKALDK
jgi:cytochrome c-type biogenesis protein CcmH